MNYIKILLFMVFCINTGYGQLVQEWSISIPNDRENQQITFSASYDDMVVFNKTWFEIVEGEREYNHHFYVTDYNGAILWDYDWSADFEDYHYIKMLKNDITNKIFFLVEDIRNIEPDFIGLLTPFDGVAWLNEIESQYYYTNGNFNDIAQIGQEFLYLSPNSEYSKLIRINDLGEIVWDLEKTYGNKFDQVLISNNSDKIMWLVNGDLHLIDSGGNTLSVNDSKNWNPYYNVFCLDSEGVNTLGWGLDFYVEKYDTDFEQVFVDILPYTNNSFLKPIVHTQVDENDNVIYSGQNIPGIADETYFILKYDNEAILNWTHLPSSLVITLKANTSDIIYTTPTDVVQVNATNGNVVDQVSINDNSPSGFTNNYHSVVDFEGHSVFVFTLNGDGNLVLTKFSVSLSSPIVENETFSFDLFPNPSNDYLVLKNYKKGICVFYNMAGQLVMKKDINSDNVDISKLTSGTYMAMFLDENGVVYSNDKFIKK